ncbi:MAG: lipoate--protein ligase [Treponema sp.]|nr:lipoate--protein ligase [Treponema sp.]
MRLLYHVTDSTDPFDNLALEEFLFSRLSGDQVILYLWQNENTVVIGRNQNAWRECRLDVFAAQNGRLVRRLTGGGAMYQDMGNQNFTFFAPAALYDVEKQTEVIRLAVKSFGIETQRSGRNDILADGRKFSGNAYHAAKEKSFHHGTILISSDLGRLSGFLTPSPEKIQSKGVQSVASRVVNLRDLCPELTPQAIRAALLRAFAEVYGEEPQPFDRELFDTGEIARLRERYADDDWRIGRLSRFDYNARRRFSFGELEFDFSVENGRVSKAAVHSDALDAAWVLEMERGLLGAAFTAEALAQAIPAGNGRDETAEFFLREFRG